jgi:hypothetical protein
MSCGIFPGIRSTERRGGKSTINQGISGREGQGIVGSCIINGMYTDTSGLVVALVVGYRRSAFF